MEFLESFPKVVRSAIIMIVMFSFSCSQLPEKNSKQIEKDQASKPPNIKKPPSSFEDTVVINCRAAVFYNPDSLQLNKIKSVNETNVYATITHDCYYQMQNARNVIRKYWPQIQVVEVTKARFLLFVKKDKSKIYIDLNAKNDICGSFLFDPEKDPELADMTNIDTFLGFYFGK
ncbi:MAG TPA: hypothetical protein VFI33_10000 [Puia sp.]|nr:hypothetical protein [Puia sp.]